LNTLKKFIRYISPPILIIVINKIKLLFNKNLITSFNGLYEDFSQIKDENPWEKDPWIKVQEKKLDEILAHKTESIKNKIFRTLN
tara:strand:- start:790 stop:1044 length:255 start_codon:yes stop_codon:yes gene_type:complete